MPYQVNRTPTSPPPSPRLICTMVNIFDPTPTTTIPTLLTYSDLLKYLPCQERAGGARVTSSQITLLSLPQVQAVLANSSLIASIYSVCKRTMSPIIPLHRRLRHLPPCLPQRPLQTSALDLPRHNYHSSRTMSTHAFQESEAQFPTWSSALAQP